jgi:triosephosphate isomerase
MMINIFVNLKRFEVPKHLGGICPMDDPQKWIEYVIDDSVRLGLGSLTGVRITFLLPEGLISRAIQRLKAHPEAKASTIAIGCQGVHWEDIAPRGNFGAFTTTLPATAAKNLGCTWAILGHSEERRAKLEIIQAYERAIEHKNDLRSKAAEAVNRIINAEVLCALRAGLNVLLCVGETAQERGEGDFTNQQHRIRQVLRSQLVVGLQGVNDRFPHRQVVIGYEPVWAIGPGKTPPGKEYISFVSSFIKEVIQDELGFDPVVVYGGGLKVENAGMLSSIETVGGGLVALTRFTGEIGFEVEGLKRIIEEYVSRS